MYALYIFGTVIEDAIYPMIAGSETEPNHKIGSLYYIVLYTGGIYASTISEYFKNKDNPNYLSLGASGAINALVFSFILYAPTAQLGFFFIPMPAWVFGILFLGVTFYLSKRKTGSQSVDRIGHDAHFWGAIWGIVFTGLLKPELFTQFIYKITH
jgi:membrane associated rhomboid family serine protease